VKVLYFSDIKHEATRNKEIATWSMYKSNYFASYLRRKRSAVDLGNVPDKPRSFIGLAPT